MIININKNNKIIYEIVLFNALYNKYYEYLILRPENNNEKLYFPYLAYNKYLMEHYQDFIIAKSIGRWKTYIDQNGSYLYTGKNAPLSSKLANMAQTRLIDNAFNKIKDLLVEEKNPDTALRMSVKGGGCSGFQYEFTFDEKQEEDDFVIEKNGVKVFVDSVSAQYLMEATLDYKEEKFNSQFVIHNPEVKNTCGCGSSFSI